MKLIFWIRSVLATLFAIFSTALTAVLIIFVSGVLRNRALSDKILYIWGRSIAFVFNIEVSVRGTENLPEGGCLLVFNHSSHFDVPIIAFAVPKSARFGAKIELFKIPIFGRAMRVAGALPIVRADPGRVFKLYDESIARVHAGESFILAAEGTRQPVPGVGSRFKSGPFVFAIKGQFPLVPVVVRGAAECLPKGDIVGCTRTWGHKVTLQILKPLSTKGLTLEDRQRLQEEMRKSMTTAYSQG